MKVGATLIMALMLAAFLPGVSLAGPVDTDGDGIPDATDTCPLTFNPGGSQTADQDSDTVPDSCDNCQYVANPNQCDSNGDGFGNVCDHDLQTAPPGDTTGQVTGPDFTNPANGFAVAFNNAFTSATPCTINQDFDDSTVGGTVPPGNEQVTGPDFTNPLRGFAAAFNQGRRMDGGTAGSCGNAASPGSTCLSGMTCAALPPVNGGCPPEVGFFAP